jgi:hypothetical protein
MKVFVLLETKVGTEREVAHQAERLPAVDRAELVTGCYDIIVGAHLPDGDAALARFRGALAAIEGVTRTVACPVKHAFADRELSPVPI